MYVFKNNLIFERYCSVVLNIVDFGAGFNMLVPNVLFSKMQIIIVSM